MNSKGFTLIELLIVIVIIGIIAALATREYSKYVERANLAAYALPLIKDCFTEIEEYCAQNPGAIIDVTSPTWPSSSTCKRLLTGGTGILTGKGFVVNVRPDFPNRYIGTVPNYPVGSIIEVRMTGHNRYKLERFGKRQNESNIGTPECELRLIQ